jgi:hypothetical protein
MYILEKVVNGRWVVVEYFQTEQGAMREVKKLETSENAIVRVGYGYKFVYLTETQGDDHYRL